MGECDETSKWIDELTLWFKRMNKCRDEWMKKDEITRMVESINEGIIIW